MSAAARDEVHEMTERWRASLVAVKDEARAGRPAVERALADATSAEVFDDLETELAYVARRASRASIAIEELASAVRRLKSDWAAEWRHHPAEVRTRAEALVARASEDPEGAVRRWLTELLDALDARRWDVVEVLAAGELAWPAELEPGIEAVREGLDAWRADDFKRARETVALLGRAEIPSLETVLDPALRSRAHRLAAWISLRRLNDSTAAREHLDEAVGLHPRGGRMHGERAAYFLFIGELGQAAADAQHAIELALDTPAGYLELGTWAELSGDYSAADESYAAGLERMSAFEIARLHRRASMIDPPGRLLLAAAERLLELGRPAWSADLCDRALSVGVRGAEPHPEADAYRVHSVALQAAGQPARGVATAAMNAGRLYLWNGEVGRAIAELERAIEVDDSLEEAGWILADARLSTSLPAGETLPHHGSVSGARDAWEAWQRKVGPPGGETSWAYLTRAIVADLMTQRPGTDRKAGIWEAVAYVERALVHDDADALRWGYAARYLRYAGLEELAFEAVNRGYELSSADREVLAERLPMLASRGMLDAVEEGADRLYRMYGPDPWVGSALAWVAMHRGEFAQAIELLEMPIAEGNDPAWYYDMRALCHLALGDVDAALEDYRTLRATAPAVDGTTKSRLAIADVVAGESDAARVRLREAEEDATTDRPTYLAAAALAALAENDLAGAGALLEDAIDAARSAFEVDDILRATRLRSRAVGDGDLVEERNRLLDRIETEVVPSRRAAVEADPPTPDSELESALRKHDRGAAGPDLDEAETALLAVAGRRHARDDRLEEAVACYERLADSGFEPEASVALVTALRRLSRAGARTGNVDAVRRSCSRLGELGATTPVREALAMAEALRAAGRLEEARDHVAEHAADAQSDPERIELERRLGALSAELGDLDAATRHFDAALSTAEQGGDHAAAGQVELRLAVIACLGRDQAGARRHLEAATAHWEAAGAFDPSGSLLEEARHLRRRALAERHWTGIAGEALDWIEAVLVEQADRQHQPA